jgi:hypothetical protein
MDEGSMVKRKRPRCDQFVERKQNPTGIDGAIITYLGVTPMTVMTRIFDLGDFPGKQDIYGAR